MCIRVTRSAYIAVPTVTTVDPLSKVAFTYGYTALFWLNEFGVMTEDISTLLPIKEVL